MTEEGSRVVAGFFRLTESDQRLASEIIAAYMDASTKERREQLVKGFAHHTRIDTGPIASGRCPCCGR